MTSKNVSETAHDQYLRLFNELFLKDAPFDPEEMRRKGEDLDFFGKR